MRQLTYKMISNEIDETIEKLIGMPFKKFVLIHDMV
jgi:hypothetical protein